MAKYYALVSGLPTLTAEMQRPPLSVAHMTVPIWSSYT